jgi:uncharacterized coiled-coil DUF342 family protein
LSTPEEKIEKLNQKLSMFKEEENKLNAEAETLAEKRDKLNEKGKHFHAEIQELKKERDSLNEKVKELKQQRTDIKTKISQKIEEAKKLREEIRTLSKKKPPETLQELQKTINSIEWKIQTTHLDLQEEKRLVEKVKQLGTRLNVQKKLEGLNTKMIEQQAELKALQTNSKTCHEKLTEIAQQSQKIHEKMLAKVTEAKKVKTEADSVHQLFLSAKEKTKPIQQQIDAILNDIGQLKGEIRTKEAEKRKKKEETILEELERQALGKLKRGEKLMWEEFQLLVKKGLIAQD